MNRLQIFRFTEFAALSVGLIQSKEAACAEQIKPPNVLLIVADDLNYSSVGYRGSLVPEITPNLDKFAKQGIVFEHAHIAIAVSQPSRGALATGMYPHNSGVEGFYQTDKKLETIMSILRKNGYRIGIAGKAQHSNPIIGFEWDTWIDQPQLGMGRDPQKYYKTFKDFVQTAKKEGKPFYFMANSHDPHRPFHGSAEEKRIKPNGDEYPNPSRVYSPDEIIVPGFLPDIPAVRKEIAQYFSSVRRLDDMVGAILNVLDEENLSENTLVMFLSDNGISAPFAKTNCYLNSTSTPWIVRWPGVVKPGTRDKEDFISGIDFMPTVLDICGYNIPGTVDGQSFASILKGGKQENRDKVFTQFYETSGKKRYPMFAVQTAKYGYIFSPWSDGSYKFLNDSQGGIAFKGMVEAGKSNPKIQKRVDLLWYRVPEEFYDLENDPNALKNLINDSAYSRIVNEYRNELISWMKKYKSTALDALTNYSDPKARAIYMEKQNEKLLQRTSSTKKGAKKNKRIISNVE